MRNILLICLRDPFVRNLFIIIHSTLSLFQKYYVYTYTQTYTPTHTYIHMSINNGNKLYNLVICMVNYILIHTTFMPVLYVMLVKNVMF